jgi:hypothetical protein
MMVAGFIILSGCGSNSKEQERQRREAEDMVYAAYIAKDYPRIIELVDSFKTLGCFSEGKACYWLGYAYDRLMNKRMAELYWRTGIAAVENSTDDEDVRVYAGITNRLTGLKETNAPIGLWPGLEFVGEELDLPSDSMILLYTDGLNEAENRQQEQYGEERILQLMNSHASYSTHDIIETLKADTDRFRDGAGQNDDLTMLAFRYTR